MAKAPAKGKSASPRKKGAKALNRPSFGIKLAREQCYVCWMSRPENPPRLRKSAARIRKEHHDYLVDLERKGILSVPAPSWTKTANGWASAC